MVLLATAAMAATMLRTPWPVAEATAWAKRDGWITGCNFLPSTAINQLEMWQAESWDPKTIDRELGYAAAAGMRVVRVYLHDLAWEADPKGFERRMADFLRISKRHGIKALFVFFDDCWNPDAKLGPQPAPKPGVHNSGWVRSPIDRMREWPRDLPRLEKYVKSVLRRFRRDERVYMWDLYNEPGNSGYEAKSIPLLNHVFDWAQDVRPAQPLTVGVWYGNEELNRIQLGRSDVVTFHNYSDVNSLREQITSLRATGRPVVCTEWMARTNASLVDTHLPVFRELGVPCVNWGLVRGKSNTVYKWGSPEGAGEPDPWFHDLFWPDGRPYRESEIALFRRLTKTD